MHHITDHIHIVFTGYRLSVKQNKKQLFDVANSSRRADAVFEIWQQGKLILLSLQLIVHQFSFYFLTYTIRNTNTLITPKPIHIQLLLIYYLGSSITFPTLLFKVITKVEDGFKCYYVLIINSLIQFLPWSNPWFVGWALFSRYILQKQHSTELQRKVRFWTQRLFI